MGRTSAQREHEIITLLQIKPVRSRRCQMFLQLQISTSTTANACEHGNCCLSKQAKLLLPSLVLSLVLHSLHKWSSRRHAASQQRSQDCALQDQQLCCCQGFTWEPQTIAKQVFEGMKSTQLLCFPSFWNAPLLLCLSPLTPGRNPFRNAVQYEVGKTNTSQSCPKHWQTADSITAR